MVLPISQERTLSPGKTYVCLGKNKTPPRNKQRGTGVANEARTRDLLNHNQMLYQLSYGHHVCFPVGLEDNRWILYTTFGRRAPRRVACTYVGVALCVGGVGYVGCVGVGPCGNRHEQLWRSHPRSASLPRMPGWGNAQRCASVFAQTSKNNVPDRVNVHNVSIVFRVKPGSLTFKRCYIHYREKNHQWKKLRPSLIG